MNKLRVSFFAALALMVAFGVSGQALAQESVITITNPDFQLLSATHFGIVPPDSAPDATGLYQGIVGMGPLPATGTNDWPCFAGSAACPTIAAGGLVIGQPQQIWPVACAKCGQIFFSFETTTLSGNVDVSVTVQQGTHFVLRTALTSIGHVLPNQVVTVPLTATFKDAKAGPAVITTTTKIGTTTIHGKATIILQ